jgi:hypothetical protein
MRGRLRLDDCPKTKKEEGKRIPAPRADCDFMGRKNPRLLTWPEHDMCRRSQILRIYWALSTHACAASSRDGATAAFLTGRQSKLRTGTLFNFHAKDGSVNSVGRFPQLSTS